MYNSGMTKVGSGKSPRAASKKGAGGLDESFVDAPRRSAPSWDTDEQEAAERRRRAARLAAKKKKQKQQRTLALVLLFFLFAVGLLVWAVIMLLDNCKETAPDVPDAPQQITTLDESALLPNNAAVHGVSVGGMTVGQARAAVASALEGTLNSVAIRLEGEGIATTLTRAELGLYYDLDAALLAEMNKRTGKQDVAILANEGTLKDALYALNETIPNHAVNATFEITYDSDGAPTFVYTDGQNGMQLDYAAISASVTEAIAAGQYQAVIAPKVAISEPDVTTADLKARTSLRASFTTEYKYRRTSSMSDDDVANAEARHENITKAAQIVNGTVLKPGETFSFNDATGKRSGANGWKEAKAVYDGSYRKETGGGVCQITTTMFNALLRGGLFDISHREHSIPSDYVEMGFDATVDYGTIDFKFENDTEHNLYIFTYVTQSSSSKYWKIIHVDIYGEALPEGVEYRCRSIERDHIAADTPEIIEDRKMPEGEKVVTRNPHDKYVVSIFVDKYVNGEKVETPFEYTTSKYELIQEQIRVGTSVAPTEVPPEPEDTPPPPADPPPTDSPADPPPG